MDYPKNVTYEIAWTDDNTENYSQDELDAFNDELSLRLEGIEMFSSNWYQEAKWFADEVARR